MLFLINKDLLYTQEPPEVFLFKNMTEQSEILVSTLPNAAHGCLVAPLGDENISRDKHSNLFLPTSGFNLLGMVPSILQNRKSQE